MNKLFRFLSRGFVRVMVLLGMFGIGLWVLAQIVSLSGRSRVTAPIGGLAGRYRSFATTGQ